jgi:hypothetical protein
MIHHLGGELGHLYTANHHIMKLLLPLITILISLVSYSIAIWPFDYWDINESTFPVLSTEVNSTKLSLDNLNSDVLHKICSIVQEQAVDDIALLTSPDTPGLFRFGMRLQSFVALRGFPRINKHFHNLTSPITFQDVK